MSPAPSDKSSSDHGQHTQPGVRQQTASIGSAGGQNSANSKLEHIMQKLMEMEAQECKQSQKLKRLANQQRELTMTNIDEQTDVGSLQRLIEKLKEQVGEDIKEIESLKYEKEQLEKTNRNLQNQNERMKNEKSDMVARQQSLTIDNRRLTNFNKTY